MKTFLATFACVGLVAGYLGLGVTPSHADANVISAQSSCMQAAFCAAKAQAERTDPKHPGMGPKFDADKADCQKLAAQCQQDMKAPEPK